MGYEMAYYTHCGHGRDSEPDAVATSIKTYCIKRTSTVSLRSAAKTLWKFSLAGGCFVTVSASRHRPTGLICMKIHDITTQQRTAL